MQQVQLPTSRLPPGFYGSLELMNIGNVIRVVLGFSFCLGRASASPYSLVQIDLWDVYGELVGVDVVEEVVVGFVGA